MHRLIHNLTTVQTFIETEKIKYYVENLRNYSNSIHNTLLLY